MDYNVKKEISHVVDEYFREIAEWMTETGLERTCSGSYYIYFEDIAKTFHVTTEWVREYSKDIMNWLDWEIIAECDIEDDSFSLYFYLQYCCEHCATYKDGNRCYEKCGGCDCWCNEMEEEP